MSVKELLSLDERTLVAIHAAESKKAADMTCLDIRGLSDIADRFIIFSGTSTTHVQQVAEEIEAKLRSAGEKSYSVEGLSGGRWVLMDFGDIVIHVFHHETRRFYDLDRLWGDAPGFEIHVDSENKPADVRGL